MHGWPGPLPEPDIRTIEDMRQVLATPGCNETGPLYFMYRGLALNTSDRQWLQRQRLRYDITAILPRDICAERAKTKGHYHPPSPSGIGYPEIYEVLLGHAHYLLQERNLSNVILVDALEKDIIIVPPGYGHVTINAGADDLIMANIVSTAFQSDYREYERKRGAAYYELTDGSYLKNPAYTSVPELQIIHAGPIKEKMHLASDGLYEMIGTDDLKFLNNPDLTLDLFSEVVKG